MAKSSPYGARVAIIGVGNAGSTFLHGLQYYGNANNTLGLWHPRVGGLTASTITIAAAFDIDPTKAGQKLSQILIQNRNDGKGHSAGEDPGVQVSPGLLLDDPLPHSLKEHSGYPKTTSYENVVGELERSRAQIVINLISSGMNKTSAQYAEAALEAGASFVNATPAKIGNNKALAKKFLRKGLVLAGDDLLSQFGGTAFHKGMIDFMVERGVHVRKSYQLDVGGSSETKNTMDERIRMMKRTMKTGSISIEAPYYFKSMAGTTEFTDFLGDSRNSYYWMSSDGFMGMPIVMDLTLRTNDGANAGNVLLDIVRAIISVDRKKKFPRGSLEIKKSTEIINAYAFKNPPKIVGIRNAYSKFVESFV